MKKELQSRRAIALGSVRKDTLGSYGPNMETVGLWTKPGLQG